MYRLNRCWQLIFLFLSKSSFPNESKTAFSHREFVVKKESVASEEAVPVKNVNLDIDWTSLYRLIIAKKQMKKKWSQR